MAVKSRIATAATALAAVGALAALGSQALAEVSQKGGVRVSVTAKMTPTELPRQGSAPIAVSVASHIAATQAGSLPQLIAIAIAINRYGRLDLRGLPRCRLGHINPSTTFQALAACRDALIGTGSFTANVKISEQSPFPSEGDVYAFNGRLGGKPAIFAHIYGTEPVPTSYVLPFSITQAKGTYGTLLEASLPRATGNWGYVTGLSLKLDRRYTAAGEQRSYLSAGCPAPKGFPGASFALAKTTFSFEGGLHLSSILNRSCKVR